MDLKKKYGLCLSLKPKVNFLSVWKKWFLPKQKVLSNGKKWSQK